MPRADGETIALDQLSGGFSRQVAIFLLLASATVGLMGSNLLTGAYHLADSWDALSSRSQVVRATWLAFIAIAMFLASCGVFRALRTRRSSNLFLEASLSLALFCFIADAQVLTVLPLAFNVNWVVGDTGVGINLLTIVFYAWYKFLIARTAEV